MSSRKPEKSNGKRTFSEADIEEKKQTEEEQTDSRNEDNNQEENQNESNNEEKRENDENSENKEENPEKKTKNQQISTTKSDSTTSGGPPPQKRKLRMARVQVAKKKQQILQKEESGGDYNIWYHKYIGYDQDRIADNTPAATRVNIARDSGWTQGCLQNDSYFCVNFAKGCCDKGPDCLYLHRIPTEMDQKRIPISRDCFGREKHATDKDDMSGVGSFNRESKTLYLSNFKNFDNVMAEKKGPNFVQSLTKGQKDRIMKEIVERHFKEFGEIQYVRIFPDRCYGFVKYKNRVSAEFAREAMNHQALDFEEVLSVKWACDDPNPIAVTRNQMDEKMALLEAMKAQGVLKPTEIPQLTYLNDNNNNSTTTTTPAAITAPGTENPAPTNTTSNSSKKTDQEKQIYEQTLNYYYTYYYNYYLPLMNFNVAQAAQQAKQVAESVLAQQQPAQPAAVAAAAQEPQKNPEEAALGPKGKEPGKTIGDVDADDVTIEDEHKTDYYNYIHRSIRTFKVEEKKIQQEQKKLDDMRAQLDSEVVDLYPNTDEQFQQ